MDRKEKLQMLRKQSEADLTKNFLIPLYESNGMGCKSVRYTHRRLEFGRDVIYYKEDEYGNRVYTGVQVKKTKITTNNIADILRQTMEAFGEPFTDLSDGKKKDVDRFVVLTSNEFTEEAKESFWASLRGTMLDRLVTSVDGTILVGLIDEHSPSLFYADSEYCEAYIATLKEFGEMLDNTSLLEEDFKQFFLRNPWILWVGLKYKEILCEQRAGTDYQVDFLLRTFEDFCDIVELKRHVAPVIVGNEKDWRLSADCQKGVFQLFRYIEYYEENVAREHYEIGIDPYKPFGFLVIGRTGARDVRKKLRSVNSRYHLIKILTYDDLYEEAERLLRFKMQERR